MGDRDSSGQSAGCLTVVLDTNCFIESVNPISHACQAMKAVIAAHASGKLSIFVSRHTLAELAVVPDAAYRLAITFSLLPHWPVGTIGEQVATIEQLAGTWQDACRNQEIQTELERLAKSGNEIRDRGSLLDALQYNADAFVTSDRQLVGSGPAQRIRQRFGIRVLMPADVASEIMARF